MKLLKLIAELVSWFALWLLIPAVSLYPAALWMAKHTRLSGDAIAQAYLFAVALLFFPSAFLVDFLYRRFVLDRRSQKRPGMAEN